MRRQHHPYSSSLGLIFLLVCSLPAAGLETPVADPVRSGVRGTEYPEVAASDGSDYLFIWRGDESVYSDHYATHVTRDGVVLDRVVIPLRRRVEYLVWTGRSYLAVWGEQSAGGKFSIRALRLDRDGKVILGSGSDEPIRTLKEDAFPMDCVANGKNVVLGYTEYSWYRPTSRNPRALVIDADLEPVADLVLGQADWRWSFNLAWNGTHFAAIWIAGNGENGSYDDRHYVVLGIRFNASGLLDPAPRVLLDATALPSQPLKLSLQSDGQSFLMVNPADGRTLARLMSGDLATISVPRLLPEWLEHSWYATTFWLAPDYLVLARVAGSNLALRLDRDGSPIETDVIENAPGSATLDTTVSATNGRDVAIAWPGRSPGFGCADSDLFATVVSASTLQRRFQVLVSAAPRDQQSPLVAAGGMNVLAAWASGSAVYARRFSPAGSPVDAVPLFLAECASLLGVSFNGRDYFVFLSRTGGFQITRVPRDGPLRADSGASLNGFLIAAASDRAGTVVLWSTNDARYVSRLGADGSLSQTVSLGELRPDGSWATQQRNMTMAGSDDDFLIVWEEPGDRQYCTPPSDGGPYGGGSPGKCYYRSLIRGARISSDLVNRDPVGFDISAVSPFDYDPKVTWNGRQWLVAWHAAGTPRSVGGPRLPEEIRGRYVARDGTLDENPAGLLIASAAVSPTIEWDGSRYLVGWQPYDDNVYPAFSRSTRIAWVTELGESLRSVTDVVSGENRAVIAVTGRGTAVATYARRVGDPVQASVLRVFLNVIDVSTGTKRRSVR